MRIERSDTGDAVAPPEPGFTGEVAISNYFRRPAPSRLAGATVRFAAGARTPWKTNATGQTVIVLAGTGRVGSDNGSIVEVRASDVIWWSPAERQWEGATPDDEMTCFVIQEEGDGGVAFGDRVTDDDYRGGPAGSR